MKSKSFPNLVVSDPDGRVFEIPELEMAGRSLNRLVRPSSEDLISLPHGSALFGLPGRSAIGYDRRRKRFVTLEQYRGQSVQAVGAFMAPAHSQILTAACARQAGAPRLPLFAYTAAGWHEGHFVAAGLRVDADIRQDASQFNDRLIQRQATAMLKRYPGNRLVAHLVENCVRRYSCPAAQNWVLGRWEAPIPISPSCNARCLGCISKQSGTDVPVTQDRISFTPTVGEIVEYAVPHLQQADRAIVSFGQGCEGEPLLRAGLLAETIRAIRRRTDRGMINLNTNASYPEAIERICQAGLDTIRVSLNSAQTAYYHDYYSPRDYSFAEVLKSLKIVRKYRRWISLNYFIFPGFSDHPKEMQSLVKILREYRVDFIQMRNLNIDPDWYIDRLDLHRLRTAGIGVRPWMTKIRKAVPWIRFGYYNPPRELCEIGR